MRLKLFIFCILAILLFSLSATADGLSFVSAPDVIYPGKAVAITLSFPADGPISLHVLDAQGNVVHALRSNYEAVKGELVVAFNGCTLQGTDLPQGNYTLRLIQGDAVVEHAFAIADAAPVLSAVALEQDQLMLGTVPALSCTASVDGTVSILIQTPGGTSVPGGAYPVLGGGNAFQLDAALFQECGVYQLAVTLTDASGISSNTSLEKLTISAPPTPTPAPIIRPAADATETVPGDFWSMEVGNYDWEAIWEVMISPMTIIRGSGKEAQKQTYKLRKAPDTAGGSNIIGEITCESQGVNVLETLDNGWTYIEAYNSSYGPKNTSRRGYGETDELIRGYVETDRLDTFTPRTEYGLLIDKLTQRLYILTENGLFTTLLISTGYPTKEQPWNETPAGEYYLCSKVGDFPSGNMTCGYGMRFNSGDILHEVPYLFNEKYESRDYSYTEKYLGEKASHGCVRVQRKKNEEGVNMEWIWENVPLKTKLLIWDDSDRPLAYPVADDYPIYYNPSGGKYYHADQNCSSIKNRYLPLKGVTTYLELDSEELSYLKPCEHCSAPARKSEISKYNASIGF